MTNNPQILGLILSGGAGSRADGQDKGLIDYREKPLVQHVVETLGPQVDQLVIAVHRNEPAYQSICPCIVSDLSEKHEGPMAGIMALINRLDNKGEKQLFDYIALSSCDTPNIPCNYVERLIRAINRHGSDIAIAHDGKRRQNLHCLIRTQALPSLFRFYQSGGRAMHRWFEKNTVIDVDFSGLADAFKNLNSFEQIEAEQRQS